MEKIILVSLLAMPFCRAADTYESWNNAVKKYQPIEQRKSLSLGNNQIAQIPANLNLPQLTFLGLAVNQIQQIPADLNLPQLTELDLGNNQIAQIPANLDLPQLTWLDFGNNQIAQIPANLNLPQLTSLYLDDNQIAQIPANLNLPQLTYLLLNSNQIGHVDPEIFEQLPKLKRLDLSKNTLTQENVQELRKAAEAIQAKTGRMITIIADDVGPHNDKGAQYRFGARVRAAKPPKREEEE